jgi:hypothetical protein
MQELWCLFPWYTPDFYLVLDIGLDTAYMFRVECEENLTIDVRDNRQNRDKIG